MFLMLLSLQGFYGTVALIASLSLSLTDACVIWWISFLWDKVLPWPVHTTTQTKHCITEVWDYNS